MGQVIKKVGLVLVFCLLTIWLQMLGVMALIGANPFSGSGIVLVVMILSGLVFCALLGRLINLLSGKTHAPPRWLQHMGCDLAAKLNLTAPRLQTVNTEGVNAFAVDNMTRSGHVILHRQVLSSLTHDEVEAILAHEMCHIDKGHAAALTFMQGAMFPITLPLALLVSGLISSVSGVDKFMQNFLKLNSFFSIILFPLTSIILLIANRSWEFQADACAAKLVG